MRHLPRRFRPIAIDLRGFGGSEAKPVDATRGVRDFADDVIATLDALDLPRVHLVGWSLGGGVAMRTTIDAPGRIASLTLIAPMSPLGFGGTWTPDGRLASADAAGSGAGMTSEAFADSLRGGDPSDAEPASVRSLLEHLYVGPDWDHADEEVYLAAMFSTAVGHQNFPGDIATSDSWPGFGPGVSGVLNAMSPAHVDLRRIVDIDPKPPILWIRGDRDKAISDNPSMDAAKRGAKGALPGYPGPEVLVPQRMVAQTRTVLEGYVTCGGHYREVVISGVGHSPHIESLPEFLEALVPQLDGATQD